MLAAFRGAARPALERSEGQRPYVGGETLQRVAGRIGGETPSLQRNFRRRDAAATVRL